MSFDDPRFWLLGAIVAVAFAVEATTGFGATVIAVTLGVHLFPLDELLPVIVPLGLVMSVTIAWRQRAHADRALLGRLVLPLMLAGLAIGFAIFERASSGALQRAYGAFVVALAAAELVRMRRATQPQRPLSSAATRAAVLGAGVIHGLWSSGGPVLVYALGRLPIEKRAFRATLVTVWTVMGVSLTVAYAATGRVGRDTLAATAALLPVLAVAFAAGEWLHHRLDETRFRRVVYALLVAAGLTNAV
jgi:uncharacterized membrane protein YfcA